MNDKREKEREQIFNSSTRTHFLLDKFKKDLYRMREGKAAHFPPTLALSRQLVMAGDVAIIKS